MLAARSLQRLLALVAFLLTLSVASDAQARRGIMIINTGEDVIKVAELSQETLEILAEAGVPGRPAAGLMYSRFGVFWLDVVRWDSQFVIYSETDDGFEYEEATVEELAEMTGMSAAEIGKPTSYYLPPGGVLLGLALLIGGPYVLYSQKQAGQQKSTLMNDPRYQAAVAVYNNEAEMPDAGERMDAAMKILTSQGISSQDARDNLALLCDIETDD